MKTYADKKIGFIGGGQMTYAIVSGMVKSGLVSPAMLFVTDTHADKLEKLQNESGVGARLNDRKTNSGAVALIQTCDILILAVKPQSLDELLLSVAGAFRPGQLIISIISGVVLSRLERLIKAPVVRVMPNTPMLAGTGVAGIVPGSACTEEQVQMVTDLFQTVGKTYLITEDMFAPIGNVAGSSPAYVYMFIEALANAGVELGLSKDMSQEIAAQAVLGAAKMVLESGDHPAQLRENVCSPGGSTIAGVHSLEKNGLRSAVMDAIIAGRNRVREIEKECS